MSDTLRKEETRDPTSTDEPLTSAHDSAGHSSQRYEVYFENASAAEDAQQVVVSTIQKSVFGKGLTVKARGNQVFGQMEDSTVQKLSQDRMDVLHGAKGDQNESKEVGNFDQVYGTGRRLTKD